MLTGPRNGERKNNRPSKNLLCSRRRSPSHTPATSSPKELPSFFSFSVSRPPRHHFFFHQIYKKKKEWSAAQLDGMDVDEEMEQVPSTASPSQPAAAADAAALSTSTSSSPSCSSYEARLDRDARAAVAADPGAAADPRRLALLLSRAGHDAFVRRALGNAGKRRPAVSGGSSGGSEEAAVAVAPAAPLRSRAIFETLAHAFVVVRPPQEPLSLLVVDAAFRDAVAVVAPPPRLAKVLDALPQVFVGRAAALDSAVRLVAAETRLALEAEGRPIPPWRSARALLSKWMPQGSGAVVDERPSEEEGEEEAQGRGASAAASGLSPPTSPTVASRCCSPFSPGRGGGAGGSSFSASPDGAFAVVATSSSNNNASAAAVPPTALGGRNPSTPPIALVAPPLVARLSVSLLSSSLARVSSSASSAAATAAKATAAAKAAADEMRPVRRATWAPAV